MKTIAILLLLGLWTAPAGADCKKGTICRTLIENGYAHCKQNARARWRGVQAACKAAKRAKNPAACFQAITDAFNAGVANTRAETKVICPPGATACGTGCCPTEFPFCESSGICCPTGFPVDCATFCCPSDFPFCGAGDCHSTVPTTTTTLAPTSCTLPPPPPGDDACRAPGETCHSAQGCDGFPVGGCESRCAGGGFACIRLTAIYSKCTTDADCPPKDQGPGFETSTICVPPFYNDDNTFSCTQGSGHCAQPCP